MLHYYAVCASSEGVTVQLKGRGGGVGGLIAHMLATHRRGLIWVPHAHTPTLKMYAGRAAHTFAAFCPPPRWRREAWQQLKLMQRLLEWLPVAITAWHAVGCTAAAIHACALGVAPTCTAGEQHVASVCIAATHHSPQLHLWPGSRAGPSSTFSCYSRRSHLALIATA